MNRSGASPGPGEKSSRGPGCASQPPTTCCTAFASRLDCSCDRADDGHARARRRDVVHLRDDRFLRRPDQPRARLSDHDGAHRQLARSGRSFRSRCGAPVGTPGGAGHPRQPRARARLRTAGGDPHRRGRAHRPISLRAPPRAPHGPRGGGRRLRRIALRPHGHPDREPVRQRAILQFLDGKLVGEGFEEGSSSNPELPPWKLYAMLLGLGVAVVVGIVLGGSVVRLL